MTKIFWGRAAAHDASIEILVRAKSKRHAARFLADKLITVELPTQDELLACVARGIPIEDSEDVEPEAAGKPGK